MADYKILSSRIKKMEELIVLMKEDLEVLRNENASNSSGIQTPVKFERHIPEFFPSEKRKTTEVFTFGRRIIKQERWTEDNFFENLEKLSYIKTFLDGSKKRVVNPPSRALWPLSDGAEYAKVQELCHDYDLDCIRDESPDQKESKPCVYIILEHLSE